MSPRRRNEPPRVATRILLALLPSDRRGRSIAGDLMEEWHGRPPGPRRNLWYAWESIRVGLRYLPVRRRLPGTRPPGAPPRPERRAGLEPLDDVRLAIRNALRTPGASALTVLALGLGVAAPTLMFSLSLGVTRDLPVPEPDELVHVGWRYTPTVVRGAGLESLLPLLDAPEAGGLESVGAFSVGQRDLGDEDGLPQRVRSAALTAGVLRTLGVEPALGRGFGPDDVPSTGAPPTVLLSDALWRARFAADPGVLDRVVRLDGEPHTVIGVMPPDFAFPDDAQLWVPLDPSDPGAYGFAELIGRLAPGGSLATVRGRAAAVTEDLRASGVIGDRGGLGATVWSERAIDANGRRLLLAMVLIGSFVLVIACADVAHLFVARALARQRATTVRMALGAGRWRIVRQHLAESGVLAALGGLLGVGIAALAIPFLADAMRPRLSWWMEIRLDPAVLAFAVALMVGAALVTTVLPALHATRMDPGGPLWPGKRGGTGGRAGSRATAGLVIAEVALTCTLLVVAGLLTRGALRNLEVQDGYETASVLTGTYVLPEHEYGDPGEVLTFHRELLEAVASRPDVAAASITSHMPGVYTLREAVEIEGTRYERAEDRPVTHVARISPGYVGTLGVTLLRGRDLRWSDGSQDGLAALVNEPFVRRHMGGRDPIGARVRVAPEDGEDEAGWATVVGVVPSLGMNGGRAPDDTGFYLPLAADPPHGAHLLVRAHPGLESQALVTTARAAVAGLDPDVALAEPRSLAAAIRANRDMESLFATVFAFFGVTGLALAAVGLYGLTAFTIGRRLPELGIRAALGARPRALLWSALKGGTLQIGIGVAVGLGLAVLVSPVFESLFMGYRADDPFVYGIVALTLLATGAAATVAPARRASALDVAEILRAD